jgi:hypothetical protein
MIRSVQPSNPRPKRIEVITMSRPDENRTADPCTNHTQEAFLVFEEDSLGLVSQGRI